MMTCNWWQEVDFPIWNTECGKQFRDHLSGPRDEMFTFCPFCGREMLKLETVGDVLDSLSDVADMLKSRN